MQIRNIYVMAPASYKTGGTELSHQFVRFLNDNNIPSTIAYVGIKKEKNPINEAFRSYVNEYVDVDSIPDEDDAVVVVPEIYTQELEKFKHSKRIIWWMSVDNFEKNSGFLGAAKHIGILPAMKRCLNGQITNKMSSLDCADLHLYQSEYARRYLLSKGYTNYLPLSDYINDSFFKNKGDSIRDDYVLYNPKKGFSFTKQIIDAYPDFKWKAIENMTTDEVANLLRRSKVYIDFGNHPGKDRFPREAAISGCCIITGKRGAAANEIDVSIPSMYKFYDNKKSIRKIGSKIYNCINNYDTVYKDFEEYRRIIANEKVIFSKEALHLIEYLTNM